MPPKHLVTDDTDDYLQRTTGQYQVNTQSSTKPREPSDVSQPLIGPRRRRETKRSIAARIGIAVVSTLFLGGGILALISCVGTFLFLESVLPIAFWTSLASCVVCIFTGFTGIATAWKRFAPTSCATLLFAGLLIAYGVGGSIFVMSIAEGKLSISAAEWNKTEAVHQSDLCDFQQFFDCSGWSTACNVSNVTDSPSTAPSTVPTTTFAPNSSETPRPHATTTTTTTTAPSPNHPTWGAGSMHHATPTAASRSHNTTQPAAPNVTGVPPNTTFAPNTTAPNTSTSTPAPTLPNTTAAPPSLPPTFACPSCNQQPSSHACSLALHEYFDHRRIAIVSALAGLILLGVLLFAGVIVAHVAVQDIRPPSTF